MPIRAELTGVDELLKNISMLNVALRTAVATHNEKYAQLIERDAKKNVPFDTGDLRETIRHELDAMSMRAIVQAGDDEVDYAAFVEFGTGRRGAASGADTPEDYEHGESKGMPAQPYLFPAFERYRQPYIDGLIKIVRNAK